MGNHALSHAHLYNYLICTQLQNCPLIYIFLLLYLPNVTMTCNSGIAPITNGIATVTVNGLECGVTYTIIAGGTLNGDLVGPRSSYGTLNQSCPGGGGG